MQEKQIRSTAQRRLGKRNMSLIKTSSFGHDHSVAGIEIKAIDSAILEWERDGGKGQIVRARLQCCTAQHLHCHSAKQTVHV